MFGAPFVVAGKWLTQHEQIARENWLPLRQADATMGVEAGGKFVQRGKQICLCPLDATGAYWESGVKLPANQPTTVLQINRSHFNLAASNCDEAEKKAISY